MPRSSLYFSTQDSADQLEFLKELSLQLSLLLVRSYLTCYNFSDSSVFLKFENKQFLSKISLGGLLSKSKVNPFACLHCAIFQFKHLSLKN